MSGTSDVRELRPNRSRRQGRPDPALFAVAGVLVAGAVAGLGSRSQAALLLAVLIGSVALGVGLLAVSHRTSRIRLGDGRIEYRRWSGGTTVLEVADGVQGLVADYEASGSMTTPSRLLVLQRVGGGPRIRLNGALWAEEDLAKIAAVAGVPVLDEVMGASGFEERAPGIMYPIDRRPGAFAAIIVTAIVVVVFVAVFVFYPEGAASP